MNLRRLLRYWIALLVIVLIPATDSIASPVISEFLADNTDSIRDEDGERSDWIEIRNTSSSPINLVGYSLTDDPTMPDKWVFPSRLLLGNSYLIVFASGKNRTAPAGELHTNFNLASAGEYLALFDPDGVTNLSLFDPYPPQFENVSYGEDANVEATTAVLEGAAGRWIVPSGNISNWNGLSFDDSSWDLANTGIGYERDPSNEYTPLIGANGDIESAMYNRNTTAYLRIPFTLSGGAAVTSMRLRMKFDDGFAAFINGQPIISDKAPDNLTWASLASASQNDENAVVFTDFTIDDTLPSNLVTGQNILAIQGLNRTIGSSDFLIRPELEINQTTLMPEGAGFHTRSTPGEINTPAVDGIVEDTKFSVNRGFYTFSFPVEITTATEGAQIRYTTDGSQPTESNGTVYTGPINIGTTTILRAAAFRDGFEPTNVDSQSYIFVNSVRNQPEMDTAITNSGAYSNLMDTALRGNIPTVSLAVSDSEFFGDGGIYTNSENSGRAAEVPISVEYFTPTADEQFQIDAGVRIHGGNARSHPKKPLRLYFRRDYGEAKLRYPLYPGSPVEEFDQLILRGGGHDSWSLAADFGRTNNDLPPHGTIMRDQFLRRSEVEMGILSPRGKYVHVYINGTYWGVYDLHERANEDFFADHGGGEPEDYDVVHHPEFFGQGHTLVSGDDTDWNAMHALANANITNQTQYEAIQEYLDIDSYIVAMFTRMWSGDYDWCGPIFEGNDSSGTRFENKNWYAGRRTRNGEGKFKFFCWDAEMSMGLQLKAGSNPQRVLNFDLTRADDPGSPVALYDGLRGYKEFQVRFGDLLQKHFFNDGAFSTPAQLARFTAMEEEIEDAMIAESARWGDEGGGGGVFDRNGEWRSEVNWLKNSFIASRNSLVITQFRNRGLFPTTAAPVFGQHGGEVPTDFDLTLSGSGGTIYYTLDGSDPRLIGGNVSPSAMTYTGPFTLAGASATVRTRIRVAGDNWSALDEASFVIGQAASADNLAITEFHYHPANPTTKEELAISTSDTDYEFIELTNTSDSPVTLTNIEFTQGISFKLDEAAPIQILAPGARALVVRNEAAFLARYGQSLADQIIGSYPDSKLSNNGESVTLSDAFGQPISSFIYSDSAPWPLVADGDGPSLELQSPIATIDESLPASWSASAVAGGTPGTASLSGYTGWANAFFDPDAPNYPVISAPDADPDEDGLSNIAEYALFLSPIVANANDHISTSLTTIRGRDYAVLTYSYRPDANDVSLEFETSHDLSNWTTATTIAIGDPVAQPNGSETATVRSTAIFDSARPTYFRIRIQSQ